MSTFVHVFRGERSERVTALVSRFGYSWLNRLLARKDLSAQEFAGLVDCAQAQLDLMALFPQLLPAGRRTSERARKPWGDARFGQRCYYLAKGFQELGARTLRLLELLQIDGMSVFFDMATERPLTEAQVCDIVAMGKGLAARGNTHSIINCWASIEQMQRIVASGLGVCMESPRFDFGLDAEPTIEKAVRACQEIPHGKLLLLPTVTADPTEQVILIGQLNNIVGDVRDNGHLLCARLSDGSEISAQWLSAAYREAA